MLCLSHKFAVALTRPAHLGASTLVVPASLLSSAHMDRDALKRGMDFEKDHAKLVGGDLTPGSGNQWHSRADVVSNGIRWECKSETKRSWPQTLRQLQATIDGAHGTGEIPALVIDDDEHPLVLMRRSDLLSIIAAPADYAVPPSRADKRAALAAVPSMLRE